MLILGWVRPNGHHFLQVGFLTWLKMAVVFCYILTAKFSHSQSVMKEYIDIFQKTSYVTQQVVLIMVLMHNDSSCIALVLGTDFVSLSISSCGWSYPPPAMANDPSCTILCNNTYWKCCKIAYKISCTVFIRLKQWIINAIYMEGWKSANSRASPPIRGEASLAKSSMQGTLQMIKINKKIKSVSSERCFIE